MSQILVFDLGGVLIENDMFDAMQTLSGGDVSQTDLKARWLASTAAREFELGRCSPKEFGTAIVAEFGFSISADEFLRAFTGWPKGYSSESLALLAQLRKQHRLACLSNSNELHWSDAMTAPFETGYSSHLIQHIKPDRIVFELSLIHI